MGVASGPGGFGGSSARRAWAVVLSSIGISERSQGLFALAAALRTNILPLALLRHMLRMGGSVGGGNKAPGDIC